jgi:hypothetical protein
MTVQGPFEKKYVSEEETPFAKHAFLQQQDWDMFVQETNSPSFQQLSQEMKQKRALHNKPHKTGRKGYCGKRKEWEEKDAKIVAEGKQNPWYQFPGRSRPYLWERVGENKKNSSEGSKGITFSNPAVVEEDGHHREEEYAHVREEDGREQDHWNANGDEANEVHSDSRSNMLDTIDKLTEPTVCSLLDGIEELALEKVFPSQKACHSVPVQDGYVIVQPTYVWANTSQYPLPVPIDGGDVATLAAALVQRIQWPKDRIIIPPMTRPPNPEAATGSRGTTSNGGVAAQCQQEKAQQQQE